MFGIQIPNVVICMQVNVKTNTFVRPDFLLTFFLYILLLQEFPHLLTQYFNNIKYEASSLDQIKMTKKRLEFDPKIDNNKP